MAIWQFKFSFVPKLGVIKNHGSIPNILEEFLPCDGKEKPKELSEFINYWEEQKVTQDVYDFFGGCFSRVKSWDDEALMYEDSSGNKAEIWDDDINCRIDARELNLNLISKILSYAEKEGWLIAITSNGHIIEPNIFLFIKEFKLSSSYKFCKNPEEVLLTLGSENEVELLIKPEQFEK